MIGVAIGSGTVTYFSARDFFRKRRTRGGMSRRALQRSRAAPALLALATATGASCGVLAIGFLNPGPEARAEDRPPQSPLAKPEMREGFVRGCMQACTSQREGVSCDAFCDCVVTEVIRRHPDKEELARLLDGLVRQNPEANEKFLAIQEHCLSRDGG